MPSLLSHFLTRVFHYSTDVITFQYSFTVFPFNLSENQHPLPKCQSFCLTSLSCCDILRLNRGECGVFCNGFLKANCATVTRFLFLLNIHFLFSQKSLDKTAQLCYNSLVTINRRGHTDIVFGQTAVDSDISNPKIISGADSLHKDLICSAACDR